MTQPIENQPDPRFAGNPPAARVKRSPLILVFMALIISALLALGIRAARQQAKKPAPSTATGELAPDFTLQSLDGKNVRLSDFRGKAVLLNFWATWCEPCKIEMPWFVQLQQQYASQGLQIVGVAMDDAGSADIAQFAKKMNVDYPILTGKDPQRDDVANLYGGVQFLPESFYIDRDGKIVKRTFGIQDSGRSQIEENIKKILASNQVAQK